MMKQNFGVRKCRRWEDIFSGTRVGAERGEPISESKYASLALLSLSKHEKDF